MGVAADMLSAAIEWQGLRPATITTAKNGCFSISPPTGVAADILSAAIECQGLRPATITTAKNGCFSISPPAWLLVGNAF